MNGGYTANIPNEQLAPGAICVLSTNRQIAHAAADVDFAVDTLHSVTTSTDVHNIGLDGLYVPCVAAIHDECQSDCEFGQATGTLTATLLRGTAEQSYACATACGGRVKQGETS